MPQRVVLQILGLRNLSSLFLPQAKLVIGNDHLVEVLGGTA
jgi:hypothetical protein